MWRGWGTLLAGVGLLTGACTGAASGSTVDIRVNTPTSTSVAATTPAATGGEPASATPEAPQLVLSAEHVPLAGTLLVSVTGDVASGTVSFLGRTHELVQGTRSMYTFAGAGVLDPAGPTELVVDLTTGNGSTGRLQQTIQVVDTEWTVDAITFEPGQAESLLDPDVVAAEKAKLTEVYGTETPAKLWDGPWTLPIDGPITGVFGEQRSINGGEPAGHHGGTDLSAVEGTPVVATNSGRVVLAERLEVRGNFVVIDHGGGLLSGYGHMSSIAVAAGDDVQGGQVIGAVGNTGLSTGAHLHWEMSVDGILVDAWKFADGSNGF